MGALSDAIRRLIESLQISSASPGHINVVLQTDPSIDIDEGLNDALEDVDIKQQKDTNETIKKVNRFDKGNVGDLQRMTSQQFGNVRDLARNPFNFVIRTVFRKFAKGVGVLFLVAIIFEAVKFIISELLKPGRLLDIRFKRDVATELLAFKRREDQQKLVQGFSQVIITSMAGLRGGQGQTYNTFNHIRDRTLPPAIGLDNILLESSGISRSKNKGRRFS